jgi:hypothetical protein
LPGAGTAALAITLAAVPGRMPIATTSSPVFAAPRLPAATRPASFTARDWTARRRDAAVIIVIAVAFPPRSSGAILVAIPLVPVAIPLVLDAIPLVLDVLFAARGGTASAACARSAHRLAALTQPLAERVDLAADRRHGSCLPGVDKTAFHLVGQLGDLRRRAEQLCALLDQATRARKPSAAS